MAKKKRGKLNDSRGYGQPPGTGGTATGTASSSFTSHRKKPASSSSTSVSSQTHDGMKSLLDQMKQQERVATTSTAAPSSSLSLSSSSSHPTVASDRFASRLAGMVDRLTELQFSEAQVNEVVKALQYSMTLDTALDWLCLHVPTMELPTLFTDGALRESLATSTTNDSLTLTVWKSTVQPRNASAEFRTPVAPTLPTPTPTPTAVVEDENDYETEQERAEQKARLLQQYEYVEDEDHDGDFDSNFPLPQVESSSSELPSTVPTVSIDSQVATTPAPETSSDDRNGAPSRLEIDLAEQEKELQELEADVNNDANNYMRTKHEIKQLRNELKKKRQAVIGMRKKVERERAKQASAAAAAAAEEYDEVANDNDDDEKEDGGGGGLLDLFGGGADNDEEEEEENVGREGATAAQQVAATSSPAPAPPPTPSTQAVVPSEWTGATPQKVLDDYCRKQKLPRPKYTKLPYNQGYSLTLTRSKKSKALPEIPPAYNSDFTRGSSLPDYLATLALYQMEPTLPLYRMFPPDFRDLWLSWLKEIEDTKAEQVQTRDLAKQQRLDYLLSFIASNNNNNNNRAETAANGGTTVIDGNESRNDAEIADGPDSWEDADGAEQTASSKSATNTPSAQGKKLQEMFQRRTSTTGYQKMLKIRSNLPMASFRQEILETVANHSVTVISAETGAGKTTQCPQFLLEEALSEGFGDSTEIIVTQPRRVAATSVAERVSEEMCEPRLGGLVGYQIRMEAKRSAETKLLFCTTGIVLRRLQEDRSLKGITHVIVDEVHERQQQTDVLLIALRELLRTARPDLKVVLMSATLDSNLFCSFFGNAPFLSVPGRTFPVSSYHLEDLMDTTNHIVEEGSRYALRDYSKSGEKATLWVTNKGGDKRREVADLVSQIDIDDVSDLYPGYKMTTRRSMDRVNEEVINYDLLEDVLGLLLCRPEQNTTLLPPDGVGMTKGSVLVFLPGLGEIRSLTERLEGNRSFRDPNRFEIIPMHSTLSSKDQRRAFMPAKAGCRKIILSTNIAETSVTIPDVVCVIDTGRVREVRRNRRTSTSILVTDWCSKASAKQRAGRAGRVQPGICLKLFSSHTAQAVMKPASEPELRRVPLEEVCLSILASGFAKSSMDFLSKAPQPPSEDSVKAAVNVLEEVGAIEVDECTTAFSKRKERLTPLGRHLAKLPVDVRLGKMLIFGAMFRCLDQVLTIAATLSSQSPFSTFMKDASVAKAKQRAFCDPDSDFVTYCNVWEAFQESSAKSTGAERKFCQANFLNYVALREIGDARRQFLDLLCGIGFVDRKSLVGNGNSRMDPTSLKKSIYNENSSNLDLLHAVICAGLYPNVAHLKPATTGDYTLFYRNERLFFHNTSVNSRKKIYSDGWVVFHEKFGTPSRVSVATTCFVHPFALLLLGGSVVVRHTQRLVVVDGWIEIQMAAQIGVIMKELRKQVDALLVKMIEKAAPSETELLGTNMVKGIVDILST